MTYKVAALYQFVALPDFRDLREPLRRLCEVSAIKGTLLLAQKASTARWPGAPEAIDALLATAVARRACSAGVSTLSS